MSCEKSRLEHDCIEGMIPESILYKMRYADCYPNSIWVEVLNDKNMGQDITIHHASPVLHPIEPTVYANVVELIFTDDFLANHSIEELAGKKIYFKYRQPTNEEIEAAHPSRCGDNIYEVYQTSIVVATGWSFDTCPSTL